MCAGAFFCLYSYRLMGIGEGSINLVGNGLWYEESSKAGEINDSRGKY